MLTYFFTACVFPYYMNLAASTEDKVERIKFVITATLSSYFWTAYFMKPVIFSIFQFEALILLQQLTAESHHWGNSSGQLQ